MKIRALEKKDIETVAEIFRTETSKKPYSLSKSVAESLEATKNFLEKETAFVFEIEDKIVGFVACQEYPNKKEAYVNELWILEANQHQGIGRKAMQHIENVFKEKGFEHISLVSNKYSHAYQFYKKINYEKHPELTFLKKKI